MSLHGTRQIFNHSKSYFFRHYVYTLLCKFKCLAVQNNEKVLLKWDILVKLFEQLRICQVSLGRTHGLCYNISFKKNAKYFYPFLGGEKVFPNGAS